MNIKLKLNNIRSFARWRYLEIRHCVFWKRWLITNVRWQWINEGGYVEYEMTLEDYESKRIIDTENECVLQFECYRHLTFLESCRLSWFIIQYKIRNILFWRN